MEILEKEVTRRDALGYLTKVAAVTAGSLMLPRELYAKLKSQYKTNDLSRDSEEILLARLIYGEARILFKDEKDQREPAMIGFTSLNRAKDKIKGNGTTLKEVILSNKPKRVKYKNGKKATIRVHQYSCFNSWDPNLRKLKDPEKYDSKAWQQSLDLSKNILEGKLSHLNYGQDHYHKKDMEEYPKWTKSPRMKKIWGQEFFKHYFYRDIKA